MNNTAQQGIYLQGVAGQYAGQRLPVGQSLVLGSDSALDTRLDDPAVTAKHLKLTPQDGRLMIESLSGADDTWVNGQPVQRQLLTSGDEIRLGRQRFVVKIPGLRPDSVLRDLPPKRRRAGWVVWFSIAVAIGGAVAAYWYYLVR